MNTYNNDTLPYQNKIVSCIVPDDETDIFKIMELAKAVYSAIYGILVLIFPDKYTVVKLNTNVPLKIMKQAEYLSEMGLVEKELQIVPFPKKQ